MKLIDPSQRINVLWDNDDGTRYTEEMTIRRLLAVMSDDEVKTIDFVRCGECKFFNPHNMECEGIGKWFGLENEWGANDFCSKAERRADDEAD